MGLPWRMKPLRWWARQRWVPFGLRDRILRMFADSDNLPSLEFVSDFCGMRYAGDLASFIDWSVFFYGAYEPALLAFLGDTIDATGAGETVVLDIGANVGQHTLFLAPRVARVHAFEPWAPARTALERNLRLNRVTNVRVHPEALADRPGSLPFFAPTTANRGTGSFLYEHNISNQPIGSLPLARGDDVLAVAGEDRVDLIKIDTEGFEDRVLAGLSGTLARYRPIVVFELSPNSTLKESDGITHGLAAHFDASWVIHCLAGNPEEYVLQPFDGGSAATLVAVPREKEQLLPRRGS